MKKIADFLSDTSAPAHPKVLEKLAKINKHYEPSYGDDAISLQASALLEDIFECKLAIVFVTSGTAANALALSTLTQPGDAIICHEEAHVEHDERGAVEFFSGARLAPLGGAEARLSFHEVEATLKAKDRDFIHMAPIEAMTLSNLTELGTCYGLGDLQALCELGKAHKVSIHLDGARFSNALAHLGQNAASMTWRSGVKAMSFGLTKLAGMLAEAVIIFEPTDDEVYKLKGLAKRGGHMPAKQRFMSAQFLALLEDGLWLELAQKANDRAANIADVLTKTGAKLAHKVEGNEVFAYLNEAQKQALDKAAIMSHAWPGGSHRFVTNWSTSDDSILHLQDVLSS